MTKVNETPEPSENSITPEEPKDTSQTGQEAKAEELETNKKARLWAMLCHLAGLAGFGFPLLGNVILPLIFWQIKKDEFPFVDDQGKEAVNFHISITLYSLACIPLVLLCVGIFSWLAVGLFALVMLVIASVKAYGGYAYRYPLTIRLIK